MIHTIAVDNVNHALYEGLKHLASRGLLGESRNGPVLRAPWPVATTYRHPRQRVLFSPLRDANPFFHLYECVWMMAGRNDAASVARYAKQMGSYAEDDGKLHGAYGYRWRHHFKMDQIRELIGELSNHETRRAVLAMWDPYVDLATAKRDLPCNTHIYFDATQDKLDMTVCNRSNDIVWGAYGANAVHMSFLQEFIALATRIPVGVYHQFSNNYHMYLGRPDVARLFDAGTRQVLYTPRDLYASGEVDYYQALLEPGEDWGQWLEDAAISADAPLLAYRSTCAWFIETFYPMMSAHAFYRQGNFDAAINTALDVRSTDWRVAAVEWLSRRKT